jgi:predicted dienelactone hydrolase
MTWVRAQKRFAAKPVLLYGHSWGGYAVTSILGRRKDIAGAVSVAGYNSPLQMTYADQKAKMNPSFGATIMFPFFWIELKRRVRAAYIKSVDGINAGTTPVLIVQGSEDRILPPTASLYDQRDKIKNPNVEYLYREVPGQAGHLSVVNSKRAVVYQQDIPELLEANRAQVFTSRDVSTFWDSLDRRRDNELDAQFTATVAQFYAQALAH